MLCSVSRNTSTYFTCWVITSFLVLILWTYYSHMLFVTAIHVLYFLTLPSYCDLWCHRIPVHSTYVANVAILNALNLWISSPSYSKTHSSLASVTRSFLIVILPIITKINLYASNQKVTKTIFVIEHIGNGEAYMLSPSRMSFLNSFT